MNAKEIWEVGNNLFGKRTQLMTLWQNIADNFYVERADFTLRRSLGDEFAGDLTTSYPLLARRDLGNTLGSMLRPTEKPWFHVRTQDQKREDIDSRRWLEWSEEVMRRAMYDRKSQFVRACKEGDHDFAAFGQCVISVEFEPTESRLLYRCWHLRDVAWAQRETGEVSQVFRRWKPSARDLIALFGDKVHKDVKRLAQKDPFAEVTCMHMVVQSDMCDGSFRTPFCSIYYDEEHQTVLEMSPSWSLIYVIPRWQTVSGSQYAYSPATVAALPDARLIQAMTLTLLEAGEKATNPPMVAVQEAIRSDISIYPGGVTWVDASYDERLGEVLRPITQDKSSITLGVEMQRDSRQMIAEAFYLNKLSMMNPERGKAEMTAFEVGQMVQEYIRNALPIFEPMESEYNGAVCEATFDLIMRQGGFGSPQMMPRALQGAEIEFRFESPLHDAIESVRSHQFQETKALLADAVAIDPTLPARIDIGRAFKDAVLGIGAPSAWVRDDREYEQAVAEYQKSQQTQQTLANLQAGGDAAKSIAEARQALEAGGGGSPMAPGGAPSPTPMAPG